jgi:phosphatidylglycerophosphatase A
MPFAPGTWASALTLLALRPFHASPIVPVATACVLFPLAVWSSGAYARTRGRRDPRECVVDEALGMAMVLAGAPGPGWPAWLAGFALFRFFDVLKPPPLGALERLPRGWGISLDDVGAAAYSVVILRLAAPFAGIGG